MTSFWARCAKYPPVLVRLLARHCKGGRSLSNAEVAERSGRLSAFDVAMISRLKAWNVVELGDMRAFLNGCGIDFCSRKDMKRVENYLAKAKTKHWWAQPDCYLRKAPHWESELKPLIEEMK